MDFYAGMPLQGTNSQQTVGKNYSYSTGKNKNARGADKPAGRDSIWKLAAESYQPSAAARDYSVNKTSSKTAGTNGDVKLSENAKKLLKQLKEKYVNMDFFVASYSSDEEAQSYLSRGTKEYSVLLDPETLEAMADNADVRKQYEDILSGAGDKLAQLKEQLGEEADNVKSFGISIDKEGKVSYFAELDKISESRKKQVESAKTKKAEEKAEAAKKAKKKEREERMESQKSDSSQFVKADSIEELIRKIRMAVAGEPDCATGGFDLTM